jgi:hypothetical protein
MEYLSMCRSIDLQLSHRGLSHALPQHHRPFSFIVNTDMFTCTHFEASFLSPRVSQLLFTDATIDHLTLPNIPDDSDPPFSIMLSLSRGDVITVTSESSLALYRDALAVGNDEVCSALGVQICCAIVMRMLLSRRC